MSEWRCLPVVSSSRLPRRRSFRKMLRGLAKKDQFYSPNTAKHHASVAEQAALYAIEGSDDSPFKTPVHCGFYQQLAEELRLIQDLLPGRCPNTVHWLVSQLHPAQSISLANAGSLRSVSLGQPLYQHSSSHLPFMPSAAGPFDHLAAPEGHADAENIPRPLSDQHFPLITPAYPTAAFDHFPPTSVPVPLSMAVVAPLSAAVPSSLSTVRSPLPAPHMNDLSAKDLGSSVSAPKDRVAATAGSVSASSSIGTLSSSSDVCSSRSSTTSHEEHREKIFVPVDKYPNYNFIGRILGPQGSHLKELEGTTGCKILIRGRGSMRNKSAEECRRGKPGFEHLNEPLHIILEGPDEQHVQSGREVLLQHLIPVDEKHDVLKHQQLRQLAIMRGTYNASKDLPRCGGPLPAAHSP